MKKAIALFLAVLMICSSLPLPVAAEIASMLDDGSSAVQDTPLPEKDPSQDPALPEKEPGQDPALPKEDPSQDPALPKEDPSQDPALPEKDPSQNPDLPEEELDQTPNLPEEEPIQTPALSEEEGEHFETGYLDEETGEHTKTEEPPEDPDVPPASESVLEIPPEPEYDDPTLMEYSGYNWTTTANIDTPGAARYYSWTPSKSGTYIIESENDGGDTYGYLYDANWNLLVSNDDGGEGFNFRITYDLIAGTTYCFGAKWYSSSVTGPIQIRVRSQRPTPQALSAASAATSAGASATAHITSGGDLAYFSIRPSKTGEYIFESTNDSGDTYGYLYDADWNLLDSNDDGGENLNFRLTRELVSGIDYYFGVKWISSGTTGDIDVRLYMQNSADVIPAAEADSPTGASRSKTLSSGQIGYWSFTPAQSGRYIFESYGTTEDTYGYLYDASWKQITSDDDGGENRNFRLSYSLTAGQKYYFGAKWYYSSTLGALNVRLRREGAPPSRFDPATVASGGQTLSANPPAGGIAYFSFTPASSMTYILESLSAGDTYGYLYDANWTQLAYNDDGGSSLNFKLTYALTAGRTYYFGAKWYDSTKAGAFNVRLSMDRNVTPISLGESKTASITEAGGNAYFSFTPTVQGDYVLESISNGDTCGYLYDAGWQQIASNDDGGDGLNFKITHSLAADQTYYLGAKWYSSTKTGDFTVRLRQDTSAIEAIPLNAVEAATRVGTKSGVSAHQGERKYFSIVPTESGTYIFETTNTTGSIRGFFYNSAPTSNSAIQENTGTEAANGTYRGCKIETELTAGNTYYFGVEWLTAPPSGGELISVRMRRNSGYQNLDPSAALTTQGASSTANVAVGGDQIYFSFVPSRDGTYIFESNANQSNGNVAAKDTYGYLYDANMQLLSSNDDGGNGYNFRIDYELTAGTTYYYGVKWYSSVQTGVIPVLLRAQGQKYQSLDPAAALTTAGASATASITTAGSPVYFSFQPTASGTYVLESKASGDTRGYLYDSNWQLLASDDDSGTSLNFRVVYPLTTGETYYYGAEWYSSTRTGELPICLRRQFTVTFDANGGSCSTSSKTVINGDPYGSLPTPSNGGAFSGWYTTSSGGTQVTSSTIVNLSGNQTLYAHWSSTTLTVTFNANGGTVSPSSKAVTPGNAYGALPTPVRSGYNFSGWYTSLDGGSQVNNSTTVTSTSNHTLYARWTQNTVQPASVSITPATISISTGATARATAVISPANATNKTVTWTSGNTRIATVDSSGNVRGVAAGQTTITATASNGVRGTASVTVNPISQPGVHGYNPDFFYNFWNTQSSFTTSSSYRIPVERYRQLGFSQAQANSLYRQNGAWGGSCFGFATSSILFYKDILQESKYDPNADVPHDFARPNNNTANAVRLRSMIELLQISQVMPGNVGYRQPSFDPAAVAAEIDRGNPVKFGIRATVGGGHAVVIYGYQRTGSGYHFDIYDNSNFISGLTYSSSSNYRFEYNNNYYTWIPNNYCTYDTIKAKYDLLKSNNYAGAANLLEDINNGQLYTYLFCSAGDMTITNAQNKTVHIMDDMIDSSSDASLASKVQLILSDVPGSEDNQVTPTYTIILPIGAYTISGPSSMELAGQEIGAVIENLSAGTPVSVSADLKKIDISSLPTEAEYSVTYLTYDDLFDQLKLSGYASGGSLSTTLYADHADISGATVINAEASVSGKSSWIESLNEDGKTVSVRWLELENGNITLWIGELPENGSLKDDKNNWMEYGVGSNKGAILTDRVQLPAPVPSLASGRYASVQTLVFDKDSAADIYYTTDGSDPSQSNGEFYPGFIEINRTCKIKAIAVQSGYLPSEIVELDYVLPEVSTPAVTLSDDGQYMDLSSASQGAEIWYTVDGTDPLAPTSSPRLFTTSIPVSSSITLKAYAKLNGCVSEVLVYGELFVEAELLDGSGNPVSGDFGRLKTVRLNVTRANSTSLEVVCTVAFYTSNWQMTAVAEEKKTVTGETSIDVTAPSGARGASHVKIFVTNTSRQPLTPFLSPR